MALTLDGTLGETLPTWTTAGRPGSPTTGLTGYNTTLNIREVWNGSAWTADSLPAAGTSGNVLTSDGTNWASSAAAGGMTSLGTITPTAVNSISLGSLTLTSYKQIQFVFKNISFPNTNTYVSGDNTQSTGRITQGTANNNYYAVALMDLTAGQINLLSGGTAGGVLGTSNFSQDTCNITTASTTIYLRGASTNAFGANGTIYIYGIK